MAIKLPREIESVYEADRQKRFRRGLAPLYSLFRVASTGLIILMLLSMCNRLHRLEQKAAPALVQMADGSGIAVKAMDANFRDPIVIQKFMNDWLPLAFNWDDTVLNAEGKRVKDQGQPVYGGTVPTETWAASFALTEDFRGGWLNYLVQEFELPSYMSGQTTRVIVVDQMSQPEEVEPGVYRIKVVANWYEMNPTDRTGKLIPWNKTLTLKAVNTPASPLKQQATEVEKAMYSVLSAGLRVQDISDFTM